MACPRSPSDPLCATAESAGVTSPASLLTAPKKRRASGLIRRAPPDSSVRSLSASSWTARSSRAEAALASSPLASISWLRVLLTRSICSTLFWIFSARSLSRSARSFSDRSSVAFACSSPRSLSACCRSSSRPRSSASERLLIIRSSSPSRANSSGSGPEGICGESSGSSSRRIPVNSERWFALASTPRSSVVTSRTVWSLSILRSASFRSDISSMMAFTEESSSLSAAFSSFSLSLSSCRALSMWFCRPSRSDPSSGSNQNTSPSFPVWRWSWSRSHLISLKYFRRHTFRAVRALSCFACSCSHKPFSFITEASETSSRGPPSASAVSWYTSSFSIPLPGRWYDISSVPASTLLSP
mmetsp:Transcript_64057/g.181841  ORF Transcript_64057/g.181841 Transcript_64057/m.181841 type:complete len:357 (-) Transcript_64057:135-1205(-)